VAVLVELEVLGGLRVVVRFQALVVEQSLLRGLDVAVQEALLRRVSHQNVSVLAAFFNLIIQATVLCVSVRLLKNAFSCTSTLLPSKSLFF